MSKKKSDKELKNKKKVNKTEKVKKPYKKKRVMFISSEGGHMSELQQLEFEKYDYTVVTEKTETTIGLTKKYKDRIYFLKYGTKKTLIRYILMMLFINFPKSLYLFLKIRPQVVVSTGAHTGVMMCYIARFFGKKVIWIESFANHTTKSASGKLAYPIANTFVVQWKEMKKLYPKAEYWGGIF